MTSGLAAGLHQTAESFNQGILFELSQSRARRLNSLSDSRLGIVILGKPRKPIRYMNNTAWQTARKKAGLLQVRVHDLKHTFGRRLRTAGVPLETRKVLLGHKTGDITSHYSAPELAELIRAANAVLKAQESTLLRVVTKQSQGSTVKSRAKVAQR